MGRRPDEPAAGIGAQESGQATGRPVTGWRNTLRMIRLTAAVVIAATIALVWLLWPG